MMGIRSLETDDLKLHSFWWHHSPKKGTWGGEERRKWVQILICLVDWVQNVNYVGD